MLTCWSDAWNIHRLPSWQKHLGGKWVPKGTAAVTKPQLGAPNRVLGVITGVAEGGSCSG